jgi:hypothetical protein
VGHRIRTDILREQRAGYGDEMVATLSRELTVEFGRGFTEKGLWRMIQFAEVFTDQPIVAALSRQLSWSHFVEIIPLADSLQREFYADMCRVEHWSVRTLRAKIQGMLFERTALSKKPAELARKEAAASRRCFSGTPKPPPSQRSAKPLTGPSSCWRTASSSAGRVAPEQRTLFDDLEDDFLE